MKYYKTEEELFYEDIENEWKGCELCIKCNNFDTAQCSIYPMNRGMFQRRKKCKHFDDSYIPFGGEVVEK